MSNHHHKDGDPEDPSNKRNPSVTWEHIKNMPRQSSVNDGNSSMDPAASLESSAMSSAAPEGAPLRDSLRTLPGHLASARNRFNRQARPPRNFSCDDGSAEIAEEVAQQPPGLGPYSRSSSVLLRANSIPDIPQTVLDEDPVNETASVDSTESFSLRDRQDAINSTHPFGIRIWKPALYKKKRSVETNAEEDIHSTPGALVPLSVRVGNVVWSMTFGLLLFSICLVGSSLVLLASAASETGKRYGRLLFKLGLFYFWPFGKYIQLVLNESYRSEDEGHGRPVSDYMEWQQNHITNNNPGSTRHLFFAPQPRRLSEVNHDRRRPFGRGEWSAARVVYFIFFYAILTPVQVLISVVCWLSVVGVPMARVTAQLLYDLRVHPLALRIRRSTSFTEEENDPRFAIVLCTYRAFGLKYYKYTFHGMNIILINMLTLVFIVIGDFYSLKFLPDAIRFAMSLLSIVPLAYFIGQAVASISAQSSMSMGATINAFFSTVVEVYLYLVALRSGKGELVEGSIIGSIMAGVLVMPGLSMCAGALKRKTQRFNPNSTGATATMLMFSIVGLLAPTLFYSINGRTQLVCEPADCVPPHGCQCSSFRVPVTAFDALYVDVLRPLSITCCVALFISYIAGLFFTLRTHAAMIWATGTIDEDDIAGHDAPNWSRSTSYIILLAATLLYAIIAEILVDSVDFVLQHVHISQRLLGITVFALVPNTAEFLNAISFAILGNVALSLEIGSAYALQVCLLQVPAVVIASLGYTKYATGNISEYVFTMLFSTWDVWTSITCILLYTNVHAEGKSNYFKGSVLLLAYAVLVTGYYFDDIIEVTFGSAPRLVVQA